MTECSIVAFDIVRFIGDSYWFNKLKLSVSYICACQLYELKLNCIYVHIAIVVAFIVLKLGSVIDSMRLLGH